MHFRNLDLNLLRVFDVVMSERNLTRAAERLHLTQPAVSNALKRLRESVGEELLTRSAFGVKPTPRAEALWPEVRAALARLNEAFEPGEYDVRAAAVSFRLTMSDAIAATLMPYLVIQIEQAQSLANLRVLPLSSRDPRAALERGEVDAAIGYFPEAVAALLGQGSTGPLRRERLYESQYVCVMRRGHPLAKKELTLQAFCEAHHVLVSFSGRAHGLVDQALTQLKLSRRVVLTVNQFYTAGRVVGRSDLLTVLPAFFVAATGRKADLVERPLPFGLAGIHVELLWHMRNDQASAQQWLRERIGDAARAAAAEQV